VFRKATIVIWVLIIFAGIGSYLVWPGYFTPRNIAEVLEKFQGEALLIYFAVSVFRGLTLLPSTPLVIAGTLLFPQQAWLVLAVSIAGILISSAVIYWFSGLLGFSEFFETRKPEHVKKIRGRLEHPTGIFFVILWAFFPLVPTDAVCYVAGSTRMHFPKFIGAIFIGELILCSCYVFGGGWLVSTGMS
jgi:uncharacterized membrane protein YdjX (TVP38/TMEM64 family)